MQNRNAGNIMQISTQTRMRTFAELNYEGMFLFRTYVYFWWLCTCLHAVGFHLPVTEKAPSSIQGSCRVFIRSFTLGCSFSFLLVVVVVLS